MSILITLLVIAGIGYLAFWFVNQMQLKDPIRMFVLIIVGIILLVALLRLVPGGIPF